MSLEKYEAMVGSGIFTNRDKLHLINGVLVAKMTQNDPHCTADTLCRDALMRVTPAGWHVRSEKPVRLPPDSKPEPDQCVVRGSVRDYTRRSPVSADVGLVVEVAESSLSEDRKMAVVYSANGIPIYWIVNLIDGQVEAYTEPTEGGYAVEQIHKPGEEIPVVLDGVEVGRIAVSDILP
jgi:Uma2 family endonuclease